MEKILDQGIIKTRRSKNIQRPQLFNYVVKVHKTPSITRLMIYLVKCSILPSSISWRQLRFMKIAPDKLACAKTSRISLGSGIWVRFVSSHQRCMYWDRNLHLHRWKYTYNIKAINNSWSLGLIGYKQADVFAKIWVGFAKRILI